MIESKLIPFCIICNKLCEKMEILEDFASYERIFVVHCHGDIDTCRIDYNIIRDNVFGNGFAFTVFGKFIKKDKQ